MQFTTKYAHSDDAVVRAGRYHDGSKALVVYGNGEVLCKPTICLSAYQQKPEDGNVFIKDYGENAGTLQALQEAGVIGQVIRVVPCGFQVAYEVPLLMEAA